MKTKSAAHSRFAAFLFTSNQVVLARSCLTFSDSSVTEKKWKSGGVTRRTVKIPRAISTNLSSDDGRKEMLKGLNSIQEDRLQRKPARKLSEGLYTHMQCNVIM
jgi:hypothetical protein